MMPVRRVNVRDRVNGVFNDTVTDPTVVTADLPGDVRLDRQRFDRPAGLASDTLVSVTRTGPAAGSRLLWTDKAT